MAKKADKIVKVRRVQAVAHWILQGHSSANIVQNGKQSWNITGRQIRKYIFEAQQMFLKEIEADISNKLAWHQNARRERYRRLLERYAKIERSSMDIKDKHNALSGLDKAINNILIDMAKLDGLYVKRVELTGKGGKDLIPSTTAEIDDEIAKINEEIARLN